MKKSLILALLSIWTVTDLHGQDISSRLVDVNTKEPIVQALIYIDNTSISATTDDDGTFKLHVPDDIRGELVITHLNYKTKVIAIDKYVPSSTIEMKPKVFELKDISIKSQRGGKRKEWLKRFNLAIFGEGKKKRRPTIVNPEVILFQEKDGILTAQAMDNITIKNRHLGYDIIFSLDTFGIDKSDNGLYSGKALFVDVSDELPRTKRIKKNRRDIYYSSKRYFYRSLVHDTILLGNFKIGSAHFDIETGISDYEQITLANANIVKGTNQTILYIDDHLSIVDYANVLRYANSFKSISERYAHSLVTSTTGRIVLDNYGNVLNPLEVIEYGYWAGRRLGTQLPNDFILDERAIEQNTTIASHIQKLNNYVNSVPQEKVYVHINKPYYSIADKVWYKLYLVDASNHSTTTQSKVVYIDLINPKGEIVATHTHHTDHNTSGGFEFGSLDSTGIYRIRAYTNYMRNYGDETFFQTAFQVFDFSNNGDASTTKIGIERAITPDCTYGQSQGITLCFYPEGGKLVDGLLSNVVFTAFDGTGRKIITNGKIIDKENSEVTAFKTSKRGFGIFGIVPQADNEYKAIVEYGDSIETFSLPITERSGLTLKVNATSSSDIFIDVLSTSTDEISGAFIIGHVRGKPAIIIEDIFPGEVMTLKKDQLPTGIIHLALFDRGGTIQAQRLVFNDWKVPTPKLSFEPEYSYFRPRQKVNIVINNIDSMNQFINSNLSVSITDNSVVDYNKKAMDALDYFLVNSDINAPISHLNLIETSKNARERFFLDQQLITKSWSRFSWDDVLTERMPDLPYVAEQGYSIRGYTSKKGKQDERVQSEVLLTALSEDFFFDKIETDEEGNFEFRDLPYFDSMSYFLQGSELSKKNKEKEGEIKMTGKRKLEFHLVDAAKPPVHLKEYIYSDQDKSSDTTYLNQLATIQRQQQVEDSLLNVAFQVDIEEVTIKGRRKRDLRIYNIYDLNEMDWIEPNIPARSLLATLKPGKMYQMDILTGGLVLLKLVPPGIMAKLPVFVSIDGIPAPAARLYTLTAAQIDYIGINDTFISVTTRKNKPRGWAKKFENGRLHIAHPGYGSGLVFVEPEYPFSESIESPSDLRTALHWEPNLKVSQSGDTNLNFFAADTPTDYKIRIEGMSDQGTPVLEEFEIEVRQE